MGLDYISHNSSTTGGHHGIIDSLARTTPSHLAPRPGQGALLRGGCVWHVSVQPQRVTVHGRDAVVVVASREFERLTARETSPSLRELVAGSPLSGVTEAPRRPLRFHGGEE